MGFQKTITLIACQLNCKKRAGRCVLHQALCQHATVCNSYCKAGSKRPRPRWTPKTGNSATPQTRQLTETAEMLTLARNAGSVAGMSNVLDDNKQQLSRRQLAFVVLVRILRRGEA